jgi:hypothetical protein
MALVAESAADLFGEKFGDKTHPLQPKAKTKDKKLVDKDNAIESLVKKHKSKEITLAELLQHYTLLTNEKVLPRNLRHFSSD